MCSALYGIGKLKQSITLARVHGWPFFFASSCSHVQSQAIAPHIAHRLAFSHLLRLFAHHNSKLYFMVKIVTPWGDADGLSSCDVSRGGLHEEERLGWHRIPKLFSVIGIVSAYSNHFSTYFREFV